MATAAVLNGGRALRFGGRDKGALVVGGRTILDRQLDMLNGVPAIREVLLVGGGAHAGVRMVQDLVPGAGPLAGIHAALCAARGDAVFVLACDMPYVSAQLVSYLIERSTDADLVVPRTEDGYHPLCAVYTAACIDPISRRLAERRLKVAGIVEDVRTREVGAEELSRFGDRHCLLRNVNTPIDYAALPDGPRHEP